MEVRLREGDGESELLHQITAESDGVEFNLEYEQEAGNAESQIEMRLKLIELIEYIPNGTPGYQNESVSNA